jgi:hypothetical protein
LGIEKEQVESGAAMKGTILIIVGILFVAAGVTGLVHPQWVGREKKVSVEFNSKQYEVSTRRVTDIPTGFSIAIIVMGACTAALGGITRAKTRQPQGK